VFDEQPIGALKANHGPLQRTAKHQLTAAAADSGTTWDHTLCTLMNDLRFVNPSPRRTLPSDTTDPRNRVTAITVEWSQV
jgi:hypothetical protein